MDGAHDGGLADRRVDDARLAELLQEARGDPEGAAVGADVLADHEDARVRSISSSMARRMASR